VKRFYLFLALLGVILASNSLPSYAHTLKVDGKIGVTLHVEPDDEPVAKQLSKVLINLQDKSGQLQASPESCACTLTIVRDNTILETINLSVSNELARTNYTFPDAGIYKLSVAGKPQSGTNFQAFSVDFTYNVKSQVGGTSIKSTVVVNPLRINAPFVVIGAASILLVLFMLPTKPTKKVRSK